MTETSGETYWVDVFIAVREFESLTLAISLQCGRLSLSRAGLLIWEDIDCDNDNFSIISIIFCVVVQVEVKIGVVLVASVTQHCLIRHLVLRTMLAIHLALLQAPTQSSQKSTNFLVS